MTNQEIDSEITIVAEALGACPLFAALSEQHRIEVARSGVRQCVRAGELVCEEGAPGDAMFVILDGEIEVFTSVEGLDELILARISGRGRCFGEQAVQSEEGRRNANVRAACNLELVVLDRDAYELARSFDPGVSDVITARGEVQALENDLVRKSPVYRSLLSADMSRSWTQTETKAPGEVVFREGDPADRVYVIRRGHAKVTALKSGQETELKTLHEGQPFGELGLMDGKPRSATVTAETELELLCFDGAGFLKTVRREADLVTYLRALRKVYTFGQRGSVVQFDGRFMEHPAIVTVYKLDDGRTVVANHVVSARIYDAMVEIGDDASIQNVVFEDTKHRIRRELDLVDSKPVRVHIVGPCTEIGELHTILLEGRSLLAEQIECFRAHGCLAEAPPKQELHADSVVCHCLRLPLKTIEGCLARGSCTLDQVAKETGATTVCGGCTGTVATLVKGQSGVPVRVKEVVEVNAGVRSFVLEQKNPETLFRRCLPGQHVVLSGKIEGKWVFRPYTLTSRSNDTKHREVTVKLEPHGYLSHWLFQLRGDDDELSVSEPQGEFWCDLERQEPIVCLVAGIGMTPALAIARSLVESGSGQTLHIDYSASSEPEFVYRDELESYAREHANITVHFRVTGAGERIDAEAISGYHKRFDCARYFICGPSGFQKAIVGYLQSAGTLEESIKVEEFTPVGRAPKAPKESGAPNPLDRVFRLVAVALLALYLLQALFDLKMNWLEDLQQNESYRRWSGGFLLAYLAGAWILPAFRLRGMLRKAARFYPWHKHLGTLTPLALYVHATGLGVGYLWLLSSVYLLNTAIGLADKTLISDLEKREEWARSWLWPHVILACLTTGLALVHSFVVFAYQGS